MTAAKDRTATKPMTLQEYLDYDDGTEHQRYELWDGILTDMCAEVEIDILIESFLSFIFSQLLSFKHVRQGTEIVIEGGLANTQFPDLVVLTDEGLAALPHNKRSLVTLDMPTPLLVVEVVSSSDTDRQSRERDYVEKRREYAQRGISEYWIVDPMANVVIVLTLADGQYKEQRVEKDVKIISFVFPELDLSAAQILNLEL